MDFDQSRRHPYAPANTGLSDKQITELAFDPADAAHQTILAGTISGKIFQSLDDGANWTQKADLKLGTDQNPARIDRLVFNPTGAREPWVVKRNPFMPTDWPVYYRGSADHSTWTGQMAAGYPDRHLDSWWWKRPWSLTITADKIGRPHQPREHQSKRPFLSVEHAQFYRAAQ